MSCDHARQLARPVEERTLGYLSYIAFSSRLVGGTRYEMFGEQPASAHGTSSQALVPSLCSNPRARKLVPGDILADSQIGHIHLTAIRS